MAFLSVSHFFEERLHLQLGVLQLVDLSCVRLHISHLINWEMLRRENAAKLGLGVVSLVGAYILY